MKPEIKVILDEREAYHSKWLKRVHELQKTDLEDKNGITPSRFASLISLLRDHHTYTSSEARKTKNYSKLVKEVDARLQKEKKEKKEKEVKAKPKQEPMNTINEIAKELYSKRGKSTSKSQKG